MELLPCLVGLWAAFACTSCCVSTGSTEVLVPAPRYFLTGLLGLSCTYVTLLTTVGMNYKIDVVYLEEILCYSTADPSVLFSAVSCK